MGNAALVYPQGRSMLGPSAESPIGGQKRLRGDSQAHIRSQERTQMERLNLLPGSGIGSADGAVTVFELAR
jgi:hypothetical protein